MWTADHVEPRTGERPGEGGVEGPDRTARRPDESDAGTTALPTDGERTGTGSRTYEVTYAFNGYPRGDYGGIIDRTRRALSSLRAAGVDIRFRGATVELNKAGQVLAVSARFAAPDEGAVGRLNCRAVLPVSGIRPVEP
jgi:hypothetical protein